MDKDEIDVSKLKPGDLHYRAFIGSPQNYDLIAAITFNLLTTLGLRQSHRLLDVGCGSLRNGRLLIPYLNPEGYYGIEPNFWLVSEGIKHEVGQSLIDIKKPRFSHRADCCEIETGTTFNYILLQSIFSHCGVDLVEHWVRELFPLMNDESVIVATYFKRKKMTSGNTTRTGWIYPHLVPYEKDRFEDFFKQYGLFFRELEWSHPMQQWFIATKTTYRLKTLKVEDSI